MAEIETILGTLRRKRAISVIQLASTIGVSRQTVYAMEAGTYVPNTAVALRLARALDTTVEELFSLSDSIPEPKMRSQLSTLVPGAEVPQTGQAVQLCRVDKRLMAAPPSPLPWYFPASDAVVAEKPGPAGKARVQIFSGGERLFEPHSCGRMRSWHFSTVPPCPGVGGRTCTGPQE